MLLVYTYRIKLFKLAPVIIFILIISLFQFYFLTNNEIIILSLYFIVKNTNTHTHTHHICTKCRVLLYSISFTLSFASQSITFICTCAFFRHLTCQCMLHALLLRLKIHIQLDYWDQLAIALSSSHDYNYWLRLRSSVGARITNLLHLFVLLSSLPISSLVCVEISFISF